MDETAFVIAAQAGDQEAFMALVRRYHSALVASAQQMAASAEDAEDVAQEAVIQAYRHLATLREGTKFRAWLFAILRRAYIDHRRRQRDDLLPLDDCLELPAADQPETPEYGELLARLPLAYREVLIARYFYDLTYEEMAVIFASNAQTMRTRCFRARALLRALAEQEEEETRRVLQRVMTALAAAFPLERFMDRLTREVQHMPNTPLPQPGAASHHPTGLFTTHLTAVKIAGGIAAAFCVAVMSVTVLPRLIHPARMMAVAKAPAIPIQRAATVPPPQIRPALPIAVKTPALVNHPHHVTSHPVTVKPIHVPTMHAAGTARPAAVCLIADESTTPPAPNNAVLPKVQVQAVILNIDPAAIKELGITRMSVTPTANGGQIFGMGQILCDLTTFQARLDALEKKKVITVISRPTLIVQNGGEAASHVGDTIPYKVLSGYENGQPIYTMQSLETGVTIKAGIKTATNGSTTLEIATHVVEPPVFQKREDGSELPTFRESGGTTDVIVREDETLAIDGTPGLRPDGKKTVILITPKVLKTDATKTASRELKNHTPI